MEIVTIPVGMLETNCYLVWDDPAQAVLIDPGAQPDKIAAVVKDYHVTVKAILLTHGHFDHTGAVADLQKRYGIPVVAHTMEQELLEMSAEEHVRLLGMGAHQPVVVDRYLEDEEMFEIGDLKFRCLHTPGHTKGSCVYLCGAVLFSGDTLFQGTVGRTDFYGGDYGQMLQSAKRLADLPESYRVLCGHGPETMLETERVTNPYLQSE